MADIRQIAEQLVSLTVKECHELAKILKENYGIEPAQNVVSTTSSQPKEEVNKVEEKTQFDVILMAVGPAKLNLIKALKEMTGMGLMESKNLIDEVDKKPVKIKENISKDEALALQKALQDTGAEVEVK